MTDERLHTLENLTTHDEGSLVVPGTQYVTMSVTEVRAIAKELLAWRQVGKDVEWNGEYIWNDAAVAADDEENAILDMTCPMEDCLKSTGHHLNCELGRLLEGATSPASSPSGGPLPASS